MWKLIKESFEVFFNSYKHELKLILKDSGVLLILFGASLFYPLIYTYAYSHEVVNDINVAVVDLSRSQSSRNVVKMLDATPQMVVAYHTDNFKEAQNQFYDNKVHGIILIPEDFEKKIFRGEQTLITAYTDASYFMLYKQVLSGATMVSATMGAKIEVARLMQKGMDMDRALAQSQPISVAPKYLFNPAAGYASFAMPAIFILILQQTLLLSIGMLGGTNREKKRKYFYLERSIDPRHAAAVIWGKAASFITLHLINIFYMMVIIYRIFDLPQKGNAFEILLFLAPYLLAVCFMGIAIATLIKKRENSLIFMFFTSIPFIFLSGLSWPTAEIPYVLQKVAVLLPSTTAIQGFLRLNTMGANIHYVSDEFIRLCLLMLFYFAIALAVVKYRVYKNNEEYKNADDVQ